MATSLVPPPTYAPAAAPAPAPPYRLYDRQSVALATFLGTPIAGGVLLALNYRRLGRPQQALVSVLLAIVGTALLIAVGMMLPSKTPGLPIAIGAVVAMSALAKSLQGSAVEAHAAAGGQLASRWIAAGIGAIGLVVVFGGIFLYVAMAPNPLGKKLVIGAKDEIYYRGAATEQDARALGDALKAAGFFSDRGVTVALSKGSPGGTVISFVVQDGGWDNPSAAAAFQTLGRALAPSVGGLPITVRLMNSESETRKELKIE